MTLAATSVALVVGAVLGYHVGHRAAQDRAAARVAAKDQRIGELLRTLDWQDCRIRVRDDEIRALRRRVDAPPVVPLDLLAVDPSPS